VDGVAPTPEVGGTTVGATLACHATSSGGTQRSGTICSLAMQLLAGKGQKRLGKQRLCMMF